MRYFLNVYLTGFVYIGIRFYTAWVGSGRLNRSALGPERSAKPRAETTQLPHDTRGYPVMSAIS